MALKVKIKWKGTCAKHKKYNPEKHGRGGIRGACQSCEALFVVYDASLKLTRMIHVCEGTESTEQQGSLALDS
jgi:hypothetical protein